MFALFSYATLTLYYTYKYVIRFLSTDGQGGFYRTLSDESDFIGCCRLTSSVQNSMTLVNHVLCSKEIKTIALVLLHFWKKVMLEKVENDVPVVVRNKESEVT